jgi:hypothetical protein
VAELCCSNAAPRASLLRLPRCPLDSPLLLIAAPMALMPRLRRCTLDSPPDLRFCPLTARAPRNFAEVRRPPKVSAKGSSYCARAAQFCRSSPTSQSKRKSWEPGYCFKGTVSNRPPPGSLGQGTVSNRPPLGSYMFCVRTNVQLKCFLSSQNLFGRLTNMFSETAAVPHVSSYFCFFCAQPQNAHLKCFIS